MKTFTEYYDNKEHEQLDEGVLTSIAVGLLGVNITFALAFAGSWYVKKSFNLIKKTIASIKSNVDAFKGLFKKGDADKSMQKVYNKVKSSPEVKKAATEAERVKKKHEAELKDIYSAISSKHADKAADLFNNLPENTQENPEIKMAIIQQIMEVYKEPPLYVTSPGNETYQVMKKILGQKVAKAMEALGKKSIGHYAEKVERTE